MTNASQLPTCPQCQTPLPADAPQGLCPACLLAAVVEPTEAGPAQFPKAPPPTREQVAAAFPQLEILELIGAGGMGHVFKARQPKLDRLVALKLLPRHLGADAAFAARFEREGRLLARLSHPNIVTVHDFGFASLPISHSPDAIPSSGFYYLLMEFVDGVNLRQAMRAGRFTPVQALEVVPKICEALQFAHEQGILHRDIKPENILLDTRGRVKLVDFGIAKLIGTDPVNRDSVEPPPTVGRDSVEPSNELGAAIISGDATPSQESRFARASSVGKWGSTEPHPTSHATPPETPDPIPHPRPGPALTSATAALGTPSYMAPEQRDRPAEVDHRADIYSLGVVFYEMLTGELPVGKFAPPSAKSASDPRVDQVVLRALEQQRERRQQSAGESRTQVENIAATPGSNRREEAQTISQASSNSPVVPALATALRWSLIAVIAILFVIGCYAAWKTMSVIAQGEIGFNLGVLLLPAAIGLHRRRSGWRIVALAFLWFSAIGAIIATASQLTHPYEPVIRIGDVPLSAGATWWHS
ncbi:MAG: serine/threonine protein kinase, partial [Verrucomicrobia bacterium]|nr:serine/threonine protein kinase [Verrucomicrobiota bacterium]